VVNGGTAAQFARHARTWLRTLDPELGPGDRPRLTWKSDDEWLVTLTAHARSPEGWSRPVTLNPHPSFAYYT
jgi:hypothetical protein